MLIFFEALAAHKHEKLFVAFLFIIFLITTKCLLFSVRNGRRDNRPTAQGQQAPWAQDKDTSVYKQPMNAYGAGLIVPVASSKENALFRQPSMKPVGRQDAPWAQDDEEPTQCFRGENKKDAPWAQDDDVSSYSKPNNAYGAGVRGAREAPPTQEPRRAPKASPSAGQDAPWAKINDPSVYMKPDNCYGAGVDGLEKRQPPGNAGAPAPRRVPKGQDQDAPWAQEHDGSVYRSAANAYGVGVQGSAPPIQQAQFGRRANGEAASAYEGPANGYGAAQADGGIQAHLDAKQSAQAIRTKMSGAGNVLSWS